MSGARPQAGSVQPPGNPGNSGTPAPSGPGGPANVSPTHTSSAPASGPPSAPSQPDPTGIAQPLPTSPSWLKWEQQKSLDGAANKFIDSLMSMTGLESVKEQVLTIRDRIELAKRQGMSMSDERFNISLLGNPGTGMSTLV